MKVRKRRTSYAGWRRTWRRLAAGFVAAACVPMAVQFYLARHAPLRVRESVAPHFPRQAVDIRPAALTTGRPVYRYSVIAGGAYDGGELVRALLRDPVAAHHYRDFRLSQVHTVVAQDKPVYVSYRVGDAIYWTSHPVRLLRGETLLTDGTNVARARCGNRVSTRVMAPVATRPVAPADLDLQQPPQLVPASPTPTALIAEIFPPAVPGTPSEVARHPQTVLPGRQYEGNPFAPMGYYGGSVATAMPFKTEDAAPIQPSPLPPSPTVAPVPLPGPVYIPVTPVLTVVSFTPSEGAVVPAAPWVPPADLSGLTPLSPPNVPVYDFPTTTTGTTTDTPVPVIPGVPEQGTPPDGPNTPSTPETPQTPDTPNTPDTPKTPDTPAVPEPASALLAGAVLAVLAAIRLAGARR